MLRSVFTLLTIMITFVVGFGQMTYTVVSVGDGNSGSCSTGNCTLREAIIAANTDGVNSNIEFNIGSTPFIFLGNTPLPALTEAGTIIDGTTQPFDGEVHLQATGLNFGNGFHIQANNCSIFGMEIVGFPESAIRVDPAVSNITIGSVAKPNECFTNAQAQIDVEAGASNITIEGNFIGTDETFFNASNAVGIHIGANTTNIEIKGNTLGNLSPINGRIIDMENGGLIEDNFMGISSTGDNIANEGTVRLDFDASANPNACIIRGNEIANSDFDALFSRADNVTISENIIHDNFGAAISLNTLATNNLISQNSIYCNAIGIILNGGNNGKTAPEILQASPFGATGTSTPGDLIEVFSYDFSNCTSPNCQGKTYHGSVTTAADGTWSFFDDFGSFGEVQATATANNNTSEFACAFIQPCASYTATITATFPEVCEGGEFGFTFNILGATTGNPPYNFELVSCCETFTFTNINDGDFVTFVPNDPGIHTLQNVTDATGCPGFADPAFNSFNLTINPKPTANITGPFQTCIDNTENFQGNPMGGSGTYTQHSWSITVGNALATLTDNGDGTASLTANSAGDVTLQYSVLDSDNCESDPVTYNVLINASSTSVLSLNENSGTPDDGLVCLNEPVTFTVNTTATEGSIIFFNDENFNGEFDAGETLQDSPLVNYTFPAEIEGDFEIGAIVAEGNGCNTTLIPIAIEVVGTGAAEFELGAGSNSTICAGESTNLSIFFVPNSLSPLTPPFMYTYAGNGIVQPPVTTNNEDEEFPVTPSETTTFELLSVTDGNGCSMDLGSTIVVINVEEQPTASPATVMTCDDGSGQGTFDLTTADDTVNNGGSAQVTYYLDDAGSIEITNPENFESSNNSVFASISNGTCTSTVVTITLELANLTVNAVEQSPATMMGNNDGEAVVDFPNGSVPIDYNYDGAAIGSGVFNMINGNTIENLVAGMYNLTAVDANGCLAMTTFEITELDTLTVDISTTDESSPGANDGSATATPSGGVGPYIFMWSNGASTPTIGDLEPGDYDLTLTDDNGDMVVVTITINPAGAGCSPVESTITGSNVTCFNSNNGSAILTFQTGNAPYDILWSNGETNDTLTNLPPGTYTVSGMDANFCPIADTIIITQPDSLQANASALPESAPDANNGSATANPLGGTAPYQFSWSNGSMEMTINDLAPAAYTVVVLDANGCSSTQSVTVDSAIINCPVIDSDITKMDVACFGENTGVATLDFANGTAPFTINWSTGDTTAVVGNLTAGTYFVNGTDADGCPFSDSVTIDQSPELIAAIFNIENVDCEGAMSGSASAMATGGTAPYQFNWNNGSMATTQNNLPAADYFVIVTDGNSCVDTAFATITEPFALTLDVQTMDVTTAGGNDGSATAIPENGTEPYNFLWQNGQTTATLNNLSQGTYPVTVTDENGCTISEIAVINQPNSMFTINATSTDVSCFEEEDGTAMVTIDGGLPPFDILWSNGEMTATITGLSAQSYSVQVTDATGASQFAAITINEPAGINVFFPNFNSTCENEMNGSAMADGNGGTPPYTFAWSNGQMTAMADNLAAEAYTVTLTDADGCTAEATINIPEQAAPTATMDAEFNICNGETVNLPIVLTGTPPFEVTYSNGSASFTEMTNNSFILIPVSPSETTIYNVASVIDGNGCVNNNLNGTATVNVAGNLGVTNVVETCDGTNFIVTFEITGTNQFQISGNVGNIEGNLITSLPFPSGENYDFIVTSCNQTVQINGTEICDDANCLTTAGTMEPTPITVCDNELVVGAHNGDHFNDGNDAIEFILKANDDGNPTNFLLKNNVPEFSFISGLTPGETYFIAAVSGNENGDGGVDFADPCLAISNAVTVIFIETPAAPISVQWPDTICLGSELKFITDSYSIPNIAYYWVHPTGDTITTDSNSYVIPQVDLADEGSYNVFVGNGNCYSQPFDESALVTVFQVGPENDTISQCGENAILLMAADVDYNFASWSSLNTGPFISDVTAPETTVTNLQPGENIFLWNVNNDFCETTDTTIVIYNPAVVVHADSFVLEATSLEIAFKPFDNDELDEFEADELSIELISLPESGFWDTEGNVWNYAREEDFAGDVFFTYVVCNETPSLECPQACDTTTIKITVEFNPDLPLASQGLTPNGDGANDIWKILNIKNHPNNHVLISNRWGDVVFEQYEYQNLPGIAWDGTFNGGLLPQGAYYFILETNTKDKKENLTIKGTIYLIQ